MRQEEIKKVLGNVRLFRHMDEPALERLAARAIRRTYRRRELIFREGDEARSLFVVAEGSVKLYVTSEGGDRMLLVTLRAPDVFGELALMDDGARSASAETIGQVELLEIGKDAFHKLLEDDPHMMRGLLRGLGALLRRLTDQTADLVFLDLPGRVAKFLMASVDERDAEGGIALELELTQSDIAAMVGGSRQSVNQAMKTLERRGYIVASGRTIMITDQAGLRRRAGL